MNSPLCLSALVACSLLNCNGFAGSGELSRITHSKRAAVAVASPADDPTRSAPLQSVIPGPQRSFLRLAGISQKITPEEVLPLLSRNVFTEGYEGSTRPTEFLILLRRYVVQARELAALASARWHGDSRFKL